MDDLELRALELDDAALQAAIDYLRGRGYTVTPPPPLPPVL